MPRSANPALLPRTLGPVLQRALRAFVKSPKVYWSDAGLGKGSLVLCTGEETFWIADRILAVPWWRVV